MVLVGHSKIRESVVFRWDCPEFRVEELFVEVDFDRLFRPL
jgi:hypothetical protein